MELKKYTTEGFDRGANRWKSASWFVVKCVFFLNPIPWPSFVRVWFLRVFGAQIGERVTIRSNVHITFPWRLSIGDDVWIGEEVLIISAGPVRIESDVCISQRAFLCAGSHKFHLPTFDVFAKPIWIKQSSWIASQAFIAMGVEIGPNSMVGAGSVVLENVEPGTKVIGNPASKFR
ncbi:MAG: WcaF family extracellular polysaccharide biosynthesis acetyltransferase [Chthoniobacteraceae bacterium]